MGITALLLMIVLAAEPANQPTAEELRFFENSVRPVLAEHCDKCHGAKKQWANLQLDSREGLLKGGDSGPAIVPGNSKESLLIQAVKEPDEKLRMPKEGKLTDRQIADLMKWVEMGAPFSPAAVVVGRNRDPNHWAFQPPKDPPLPTVKDAGWPASGLDTFILAKLQGKDLNPTSTADKRTLIRRLSYDLVGLPPSPEEIQSFLADESADATARLIDRLLASPAYGEKWGRHWLDVARYADSNGLDENVAHGNAWRYRDYVVTAFNEDRPYDRFLTEQLAGDLLTVENEAERQRNLVATGFLAIGPKVLAEVDQAKMQMDIVDEQIDTVGRALLGLTLGCARCHDHKFDPIQTADYYGLAGVFKSTKTMETYTKVAKWNENPLWDFAPKMPGDTEPATAMGVTEDKVLDVAINIRGNPQKLGEVALRHVPPVVRGPATPQFTPMESGRRELAQWITDAKNPLTSRVMVNRIWRWHFGQGIVRSTDNFGLLGEKPTHPELLDWLSQRFVNGGWSTKKLHRVMLNSSTWQQDSGLPSGPLAPREEKSGPLAPQADTHLAERDAHYGRMPIRRLEAEELRDSLLAVSGQVDSSMGGSLLKIKNRGYFFDHTSKDLTDYTSRRRSLYLPVVRNNVYDVFALLDYPDAAIPSGDRSTTTVPTQALLMLNSDLVMQSAAALAERLLSESGSDEDRLRKLSVVVYGRESSAAEVAGNGEFLKTLDKSLVASVPDEKARKLKVWGVMCHTAIAANEFMYVK
ncbi:MAG: PSD1 and planctomycete cytochrome C domain-containing protein [Pirellulaceae bacterium]